MTSLHVICGPPQSKILATPVVVDVFVLSLFGIALYQNSRPDNVFYRLVTARSIAALTRLFSLLVPCLVVIYSTVVIRFKCIYRAAFFSIQYLTLHHLAYYLSKPECPS